MTRGIVEFSEESAGDFLERTRRELAGISLIRIVKKMGLARTNLQAQYVLVVIGTISFMAAIFIILYFVFDIGRQKQIVYVIVPASKTLSAPANKTI